MKVWHATFRQTGAWSYWRDIECVIVAETKKAALGWALQTYTDTDTKGWTIEEIQTNKAGVYHISEGES